MKLLDFVIKEYGLDTIEPSKAADHVRRLLGNVDVNFVEDFLHVGENRDVEAVGVMHRGGVMLSTHAPAGTEYHEIFHRVSLLLMTKYERDNMYSTFRHEYDFHDLSDETVEEILADGFMYFMNSFVLRAKWDVLVWLDYMTRFLFDRPQIKEGDCRLIFNRIRHSEYKNKPINKRSERRFLLIYPKTLITIKGYTAF
jgi:hypothetical protein